jgi:uncharacterized protein YheU (UPF0270 family)
MAYTGTSIVDYLKSEGQSSDFTYRTQLAKQYGIANYTGTAEQNTQLLNMMRQGISPSQLTAAQSGQTDNLYAQLEQIQSQLSTKQAQLSALQKYGLQDTKELTQDAQGNWIPKKAREDEFGTSRAEAEQYYGDWYGRMTGEMEEEVGIAKQRLTEDYQNYLSDIETGKVRVGTDYQKQLERSLEEKRQQLQQQEFNVRQNMENLNRQWMSRGGLFSGARQKSGQEYMTQEDMARERYTTGWEYQQAQQKTGYERSMEDYARMQERAGTTYGRGVDDISRQRLKDLRSLQETYQTAVGQRMGTTLGEKYHGYTY